MLRTSEERAAGRSLYNLDGLLEKILTRRIRTYIAFDTKDSAGLVAGMRMNGVNMGLCGTRGVRLRPMLIFDESHSKLTIDA